MDADAIGSKGLKLPVLLGAGIGVGDDDREVSGELGLDTVSTRGRLRTPPVAKGFTLATP